VSSAADVRVFVEQGTATVAVSILAALDGRWRLVASEAAPEGVAADTLVARLVQGARAADPDIAHVLPTPSRAVDLPRVVARGALVPGGAVIAASERQRTILAGAVRAAGFSVRAPDAAPDLLGAMAAALRPDVTVVVAGSGPKPTSDERGVADEIVAAIGSIAARRPEVSFVVAGPLAARITAPDVRARMTVVQDPAEDVGAAALRDTLLEIGLAPDHTRRGIVAAARELAFLLELRVEVVEVGHAAGMRALAWPAGEGAAETEAEVAILADGALVPPDPPDDLVDAIAAWSPVALDRVRLRDRLVEAYETPWGDLDGEGATLVLAAARAAVERVVAASPDLDAHPAADLLLAAGGAWADAPAPAVALALVDTVRRPGAVQLGLDHARLLGPLGLVADPDERRALIAGALDDLVLPLGTAIVPQGIHTGRGGVGHLSLTVDGSITAYIELEAGGIHLVDLPPGATGVARLVVRDAVDLGVRGREFEIPVSGGLGGLLADLRDVPLRLPSRPDRRRAALAAWQRHLWPDADR
jgi:hypothetical protein